jgi:mannose/fructose/N-acetylgalactosamine-specific phosphotransferase system component IID
MQAPVSMLTGAGNSKAVMVIAILVGLFVVSAMKNQTTQPTTGATR